MRKAFYKFNSVRSIPDSQKKSFDRSYASYSAMYDKLKKPLEPKLTKDEYLQEYKGMRMDLESRNLSVKAIPRLIANEQSHERSLFQDEAQFRALKESNLPGYEKMSFRGFRKMSSADIEKDLWAVISQDRQDFMAMSPDERRAFFGTADVNLFISNYYFGSPI